MAVIILSQQSTIARLSLTPHRSIYFTGTVVVPEWVIFRNALPRTAERAAQLIEQELAPKMRIGGFDVIVTQKGTRYIAFYVDNDGEVKCAEYLKYYKDRMAEMLVSDPKKSVAISDECDLVREAVRSAFNHLAVEGMSVRASWPARLQAAIDRRVKTLSKRLPAKALANIKCVADAGERALDAMIERNPDALITGGPGMPNWLDDKAPVIDEAQAAEIAAK